MEAVVEHRPAIQITNNFVILKSNSALLYNRSHNLLASAFPPKNVKLIKFQFKKLNISLQKNKITYKQN